MSETFKTRRLFKYPILYDFDNKKLLASYLNTLKAYRSKLDQLHRDKIDSDPFNNNSIVLKRDLQYKQKGGISKQKQIEYDRRFLSDQGLKMIKYVRDIKQHELNMIKTVYPDEFQEVEEKGFDLDPDDPLYEFSNYIKQKQSRLLTDEPDKTLYRYTKKFQKQGKGENMNKLMNFPDHLFNRLADILTDNEMREFSPEGKGRKSEWQLYNEWDPDTLNTFRSEGVFSDEDFDLVADIRAGLIKPDISSIKDKMKDKKEFLKYVDSLLPEDRRKYKQPKPKPEPEEKVEEVKEVKEDEEIEAPKADVDDSEITIIPKHTEQLQTILDYLTETKPGDDVEDKYDWIKQQVNKKIDEIDEKGSLGAYMDILNKSLKDYIKGEEDPDITKDAGIYYNIFKLTNEHNPDMYGRFPMLDALLKTRDKRREAYLKRLKQEPEEKVEEVKEVEEVKTQPQPSEDIVKPQPQMSFMPKLGFTPPSGASGVAITSFDNATTANVQIMHKLIAENNMKMFPRHDLKYNTKMAKLRVDLNKNIHLKGGMPLSAFF